jgi:hypothetical protein
MYVNIDAAVASSFHLFADLSGTFSAIHTRHSVPVVVWAFLGVRLVTSIASCVENDVRLVFAYGAPTFALANDTIDLVADVFILAASETNAHVLQAIDSGCRPSAPTVHRPLRPRCTGAPRAITNQA